MTVLSLVIIYLVPDIPGNIYYIMCITRIGDVICTSIVISLQLICLYYYNGLSTLFHLLYVIYVLHSLRLLCHVVVFLIYSRSAVLKMWYN